MTTEIGSSNNNKPVKLFIDPAYPPEVAGKVRGCMIQACQDSGVRYEFVEDSSVADVRVDANPIPGKRYKKAASNDEGPHAGTTYALSFQAGGVAGGRTA